MDHPVPHPVRRASWPGSSWPSTWPRPTARASGYGAGPDHPALHLPARPRLRRRRGTRSSPIRSSESARPALGAGRPVAEPRPGPSAAAGTVRPCASSVLASGSGTILDALLAGGVEVAVVVVDRPCRATEVAERHGVRWVALERESYGQDFDRVAYTEQLVDLLEAARIDLVVMAGLRHHPGQARLRPLRRPHPQHPPGAAPGLPGLARGGRRPRLRREDHRLHGARGHRGGRRRADPGPGRRSRCGPTTPSSRCTSGSRSSSGGCTSSTVREIVERGSVR